MTKLKKWFVPLATIGVIALTSTILGSTIASDVAHQAEAEHAGKYLGWWDEQSGLNTTVTTVAQDVALSTSLAGAAVGAVGALLGLELWRKSTNRVTISGEEYGELQDARAIAENCQVIEFSSPMKEPQDVHRGRGTGSGAANRT